MRARSILGVLVLLAAACGDSGDSAEVPELRGDGLGVVDFGDDAQTVMATLTELLGPPFADSGWEHTGEELSGFGPACLGKLLRFPAWDGFAITLTDAETVYASEGTRHFAAWVAFDEQLTTSSGLGPAASTLSDLEGVVGAVSPEFDDRIFIWVVDVTTGADAGIQFEFLDPDDPADPIVGMSAGERRLCDE